MYHLNFRLSFSLFLLRRSEYSVSIPFCVADYYPRGKREGREGERERPVPCSKISEATSCLLRIERTRPGPIPIQHHPHAPRHRTPRENPMRSPPRPRRPVPARLVAAAVLLSALAGGAAAGAAIAGDGYGRGRRLYMRNKVLEM